MAQAVSRRTLKTEVWVRFEVIPSSICGGHNVALK
jgi:hypothetical protein